MTDSDYKFLPLDDDGNLVNIASADKIQSPWNKPIARIIEMCQKALGDTLQSIYIHGSIVRGEAVEGKSDIDCIVLVKELKDSDDWIKPMIKSIKVEFSFVPKVDISMMTEPKLYTSWLHEKMLVKTLAVCVWGEDISPKIPPYKPNLALAHDLQINVRKFFERGKEKITHCPNEHITGWCQWVMKRFVRTGFYICMPRVKQRTLDPQTEVAVFCDYYPEKADEMRQAYTWLTEPISDRETLLTFLNTFGEWLTREAEKELNV